MEFEGFFSVCVYSLLLARLNGGRAYNLIGTANPHLGFAIFKRMHSSTSGANEVFKRFVHNFTLWLQVRTLYR